MKRFSSQALTTFKARSEIFSIVINFIFLYESSGISRLLKDSKKANGMNDRERKEFFTFLSGSLILLMQATEPVGV